MTYFLSDAHLGSRVINDPQAHIERLVGLLKQMAKDADKIYLLGDIFDFWYEYLCERHQWRRKDGTWLLPRSKRQFTPLISALHDLTQTGVDVHFFIGNHDIWTFGDLERNTGITVHRHPESLIIEGKKVFLAHGDGIVPSDYFQSLPKVWQKKIRRFMRLRAFFHNPVPQFLFRLLPPMIGDAFGYEWARRSRLKEIQKPCPYKGENKEELVLYAKEQEAMAVKGRTCHHDYYIFGHRHILLNLPMPNAEQQATSSVVILGDFFQQFTYAQMTNTKLTLLT